MHNLFQKYDCPNIYTKQFLPYFNIYNNGKKGFRIMEQLRNIREENNLRQIDVANLLGIKRSTYTSYEIERDTIPINHLNKLCNYFSVSVDYIMGLNKVKQYENSLPNIDINKEKERLKKLRKENKLTQVEISKMLNTSRSTWTGYEYGKYQIPTLLLYELCKKYKYSMDYILGKIDENKLNSENND